MNEDDQITEKLQGLYNEFFNSTLKPITKVYLDLELVQDFKLGALLSTVQVQEEIEYIQYCIPKYNARLTNSCASFFPVLKHTDLELSRRMKQPELIELITTTAPFNLGWDAVLAILHEIEQHNAIMNAASTISLVINVYDVVYPQPLKELLTDALKQEVPTVRVIFTEEERYLAPQYEQYNVLFLYDLPEFVRPETTTSNALFNKCLFRDNHILASMRMSPNLEIPVDKLKLGFEATQRWLDLFCDHLVFIKDELPTYQPKPEKQPKE